MLLRLIAEVRYTTRTRAGQLRHPSGTGYAPTSPPTTSPDQPARPCHAKCPTQSAPTDQRLTLISSHTGSSRSRTPFWSSASIRATRQTTSSPLVFTGTCGVTPGCGYGRPPAAPHSPRSLLRTLPNDHALPSSAPLKAGTGVSRPLVNRLHPPQRVNLQSDLLPPRWATTGPRRDPLLHRPYRLSVECGKAVAMSSTLRYSAPRDPAPAHCGLGLDDYQTVELLAAGLRPVP